MRIKLERLDEILQKVYIKDELVTKPIRFEWWRPIGSFLEKRLYSFLNESNVSIIVYRYGWFNDSLMSAFDLLGFQRKVDDELSHSVLVFQKIKMVGNQYSSELFNLTIK